MILVVMLGCTGTPAEETAQTCDVTWEGWTEDFFTTYCDACHSARATERHGAPESAVFDTEAQAIAQVARIRARVLEEQTMPLGGGVFPDDLTLLARWVECVEE